MENIKLTNQNTLIEKKLPHNLEAEQALIGSILINNDVIDEVASLVNPSKFFDPAHKKIFEVIENLNNKGMIANPITLKNFFQNEKGLDEVGGTDYLVKLTRFSSSSRQAIDYAKIIHEMYVKRELIFIAENISRVHSEFSISHTCCSKTDLFEQYSFCNVKTFNRINR